MPRDPRSLDDLLATSTLLVNRDGSLQKDDDLPSPAPAIPRDPLDYSDLLKDLQPNILSAHGFDRAHYFFLRYSEHDEIEAKTLLSILATPQPDRPAVRARFGSAWEAIGIEPPIAEVERRLDDLRMVSEYDVFFRRSPNPGVHTAHVDHSFAVNVLLTSQWYAKFGGTSPPDPAYQEGMIARGPTLKDRDDTWSPPLADWKEIDVLLVVAYDPKREAELSPRIGALRALCGEHLLFEEVGDVLRAGHDRHPIEPFGFQDGISQPVFYEALKRPGAAAWDPGAPLDLVLARDPNGAGANSCGTYFVFRKLEQDIAGFYKQSKIIAQQTGWSAEEVRERLIGRKRSGEPLVAPGKGVSNDFDFGGDPGGEKCPFHAHIRKSNPRSDLDPQYKAKDRRIVRRGVPYGPQIHRDADGTPSGGKVVYADPAAKGPIGLLFLCAQSDIGEQFEHIQALWQNKVDHPRGKRSGVDTLSGQIGQDERNLLAFDKPNEPTRAGRTTSYAPVVRLRGGAYFFAPSISYLRGLLPATSP